MEAPDKVSKSQRKREMQALQDLGKELVGLSPQRLAELDLPVPLLEAVLAAKRMSRFGALRRQMQYIGRVMREVDAEPIRARLEAWSGAAAGENARLHLIERWRARLVEDERALGELLGEFPRADSRRLRSLIRNVKREAEVGKPARSSRELFRELREILAQSEPLAPRSAPDGISPAADAELEDEPR
jgi:ribosome-associated protein